MLVHTVLTQGLHDSGQKENHDFSTQNWGQDYIHKIFINKYKMIKK